MSQRPIQTKTPADQASVFGGSAGAAGNVALWRLICARLCNDTSLTNAAGFKDLI